MNKRFLRISEAAERLGVNSETVRRWLRRGKMSYIVLGGRERRIPQDEVERMLARYRGPTLDNSAGSGP